MPESSPPASFLTLQNLILGKWLSQAVSVAARLGIADLLKDGPRDCDELARANQVDEAALNRLDDATFLKLRKTSGLPVAYAQLLSTGQINVLARLNLIQQQLLQPGQAGAELPVTQ